MAETGKPKGIPAGYVPTTGKRTQSAAHSDSDG